MSGPKILYSRVFLGYHLMLRLLKRALFIRSPGLPEFLEFFRGDKIVPMTLRDKELFPMAARCIGCGLCDSRCPTISRFPLGPSFLPRLSRSVPDFAGNTALETAPCHRCRDCEAICPVGVPIRRIVEFIKTKEHEIFR